MKVVNQDILTVRHGYILQQCNCITVKPAGLAADLDRVFPNTCPYRYRRSINGNGNLSVDEDRSTPGTVAIYQSSKGPKIINLFGQYFYGGPRNNVFIPDRAKDRECYFKQGLDALVEFFSGSSEKIEIAVPYKIGCGLAQGDWKHYEKMLVGFEEELVRKGLSAQLVIYKLEN